LARNLLYYLSRSQAGILIMRSLSAIFYLTLSVVGVTVASIGPAAASVRLPEPMSLSLVAGGVLAIAAVKRMRRK